MYTVTQWMETELAAAEPEFQIRRSTHSQAEPKVQLHRSTHSQAARSIRLHIHLSEVHLNVTVASAARSSKRMISSVFFPQHLCTNFCATPHILAACSAHRRLQRFGIFSAINYVNKITMFPFM
jgi:hypothetical protein